VRVIAIPQSPLSRPLIADTSVYDLRAQIEALTEVPSEAQKILGLTKTKLSPQSDGLRLAAVGIKDGARFQMVGTPVHLRFKERVGPPPPDDGIDINYPARGLDGRYIAPAQDPRNQRKVAELVKNYPITVSFQWQIAELTPDYQ
jgi:ubiquitin-like domain-containing CTD phosphatase 1